MIRSNERAIASIVFGPRLDLGIGLGIGYLDIWTLVDMLRSFIRIGTLLRDCIYGSTPLIFTKLTNDNGRDAPRSSFRCFAFALTVAAGRP